METERLEVGGEREKAGGRAEEKGEWPMEGDVCFFPAMEACYKSVLEYRDHTSTYAYLFSASDADNRSSTMPCIH